MTLCLALASAVAIFFMISQLPLSSQNGFYHAEFSKRLWDIFLSRPFENLPFSQFSNQFIDQHFGYHVVLALFSLFTSPALAPKAIAAISLVTGLFLISHRFHRERALQNLAFYLGTFFLFFSFSERLFWDRPQSVTFLFVCIYVLFFSQPRANREWSRFVFGFLAGLISFETLCVILFLEAFTFFDASRSLRKSIFLMGGCVATLVCFPFGFGKINYLIELFSNNFFLEENISEWKNGIAWTFLKQVYVGIFGFIVFDLFVSRRKKNWAILGPSIVFLFLSLKIQRFEYLFFLYSLIFINFVLMPQLKTKLIQKVTLAVSVLATFWFGFSSLYQFRGNSATMYETSQFSRWFAQNSSPQRIIVNFKWEYWSSLLYNLPHEKSVPGFSMQIYRSDKELFLLLNKLRYLNDRWDISDWESLFTKVDGRYFLIETNHKFNNVIREKQWPLFPVYQDSQFILYEYYSLKRSSEVYNSARIMAESCLIKCSEPNIVRKINSNQVDVQVPIPKEELNFVRMKVNLGLYSVYSRKLKKWNFHNELLYGNAKESFGYDYGNDYYFTYPFYLKKGDWALQVKDLSSVDTNSASESLASFINRQLVSNKYSLFYERKPDKLVNEGSLIRKMYSLYSLCYYSKEKKSKVFRETCEKSWKKLKEEDYSTWDLGSKAILGLLQNTLPETKRYEQLVSSIVRHYDGFLGVWYDRIGTKKKILQDTNYRFHVGEALTFLLSVPPSLRPDWLSREVEKFAAEFFKNKNVYSIRWLSEIIFRASQGGMISPKTSLEWSTHLLSILEEKYIFPMVPLFHLQGCYKNEEAGLVNYNVNHHDLLILEGLSFLRKMDSSDEIVNLKRISEVLRVCGIRQQVQLQNYTKLGTVNSFVGSFRTLPNINSARSDVQGHALVALTNLK